MKKAFLTLIPALGLVAVTMTSCSSDCCTYAGVEVCEDDFDAANYSGLTWDEWKEAAGC